MTNGLGRDWESDMGHLMTNVYLYKGDVFDYTIGVHLHHRAFILVYKIDRFADRSHKVVYYVDLTHLVIIFYN